MINFEFIKKFYLITEQNFKKSIIREFLQYQILDIIYNTKFSKKLYFLGGTSIRILFGSKRFSEDLDFDNFGLDENDFKKLTLEIEKGLINLGYEVEIKNVFKGAWHCNVKLPNILFTEGLSNYKEENILIQIDTVKQEVIYKSVDKFIDKFGIFNLIKATPDDILLSKKIHALIARKRLKGRDFYDILFLLDFTSPNYNYLEKVIGISNSKELIYKIENFCNDLDFDKIVIDVEPFLINKNEIIKIKNFVLLFKSKLTGKIG